MENNAGLVVGIIVMVKRVTLSKWTCSVRDPRTTWFSKICWSLFGPAFSNFLLTFVRVDPRFFIFCWSWSEVSLNFLKFWLIQGPEWTKPLGPWPVEFGLWIPVFSCDPANADCDYPNQYCTDHSLYSREFQSDSTTPARDTNQSINNRRLFNIDLEIGIAI